MEACRELDCCAYVTQANTAIVNKQVGPGD